MTVTMANGNIRNVGKPIIISLIGLRGSELCGVSYSINLRNIVIWNLFYKNVNAITVASDWQIILEKY
jgi:hypothetical protein